MDTVKVNLAAIHLKWDRTEKNVERIAQKLERTEKNVERMPEKLENVSGKVKLVQEQLNQQEESNRQLKADNEEMKRSLNEITRQLERMTQQTSHEGYVEKEEMKKGDAEAVETDREPKVVVAGGNNRNRILDYVEMLCISSGTWTRLQPMNERRESQSSVVYSNQILLLGGWCAFGAINSIESLSLNAVEVDHSIPWQNFPADLPGRLYGHCSIVYNGRLFLIGGYDQDEGACCDSITTFSLVPPYTAQQLTTMRQRRWHHGVALFGDKIVIVGGREDENSNTILRSLVLYDISKNECQQLAPLPYSVSEMATVKWGDDSVLIIGGVDNDNKPLNTVVIYNVRTQKSHILPDMKYKRRGCAAVVVRDAIIVIGGRDEEENCLKSVECFKFDKYSWEELPEMHEARYWATAVVC